MISYKNDFFPIIGHILEADFVNPNKITNQWKKFGNLYHPTPKNFHEGYPPHTHRQLLAYSLIKTKSYGSCVSKHCARERLPFW